MKEIKILIRITDDNRIGFVIDKDKDTDEKLPDMLQLIAALDILKLEQIKNIEKTFGAKSNGL